MLLSLRDATFITEVVIVQIMFCCFTQVWHLQEQNSNIDRNMHPSGSNMDKPGGMIVGVERIHKPVGLSVDRYE